MLTSLKINLLNLLIPLLWGSVGRHHVREASQEKWKGNVFPLERTACAKALQQDGAGQTGSAWNLPALGNCLGMATWALARLRVASAEPDVFAALCLPCGKWPRAMGAGKAERRASCQRVGPKVRTCPHPPRSR